MKKFILSTLALLAALVSTGALAQLTLPSPTSARAPGLYVSVLDGMIRVANPAGTSNFAAGQFGFTPSLRQPPVVLPANPGMQFTPPPAFNQSTAPGSNTAPGRSNAVDCVVR